MSCKLKVLNVLFDDRFAGPSKRVIEVAPRLARVDIETIFCLPMGEGNAAEFAEGAGIAVRRLPFERIPPISNWLRVLRWILHLPGDIMKFATLIRSERVDIVHVSGAFFLAPSFAAKLCRVPLVWHLNDTIVPRSISWIFGILVRGFATCVVVEAEAVALHYGLGMNVVELIHAPVDFAKIKDGTAGRDCGGESDRVFYVGLIANWIRIKGVDDFVRAAELVAREAKCEVRFVFAGARWENHREYCQYVEEVIDEAGLRPLVIDRGFVGEVERVLRDLDILVLSSLTEACPQVVLEGMAAGLPIVATDVGGVREELLSDPMRPAGIVVPPRAPEALAAGILQLLWDPELGRRMGERGQEVVESSFSSELCARRHCEVYKLASKRRL